MGIPRSAKPVKLICGLLAGDDDLLRRARHLLIRSYGPVDVESEIWPFTYTNYYTDEMGPNLRRKFLAFEQLIRPDYLAEINPPDIKYISIGARLGLSADDPPVLGPDASAPARSTARSDESEPSVPTTTVL